MSMGIVAMTAQRTPGCKERIIFGIRRTTRNIYVSTFNGFSFKLQEWRNYIDDELIGP
jgi:hypothetical protein